MITFWKIIAWAGVGAISVSMAVAVYVMLLGNGKPWIVLAIMAPGVVAYHVGFRMFVRERKKRQK